MTSGARGGTSGRRLLPRWLAVYALIAVATAAIATVNVLSILDERSWLERELDWWRPAVWEGTSAISLIALAWLPMLAVRRFPPLGAGWPRNLLFHLALTIAFSLAHVALMVGLRHAAYALAGHEYDYNGALLYEYRKDLLSYAVYAAAFWLSARLLGDASAPDVGPKAPDSIVIDEGHRILRVAPAELVAARSCGNYVEFLLGDGRRPLMRTTLSTTEAQLSARGFVRTHRSWLVNPRHVVEVAAEGSGDYGLKLSDGTEVPLSRRYRDALEALRRA